MNSNEQAAIRLRREFPVGARVVLDEMDDVQAPERGTQGTVIGIDDLATIHVAWDNGSGLGVAFGKDRCHLVSTEEEVVQSLDHYGSEQPAEDAICPRCGELMPGRTCTHALSRWADIMVCDHCGGIEALEQAGLVPKKPLDEWHIMKTRKGN